MKKQPFCSFTLCGLSLTDFGLEIPSPFARLDITNNEVTSFSSWTLHVSIGGDEKKKVNVAALEALLYSAAQTAASVGDSSGIPVSFSFGWLDESGNVDEYTSYQGFTLQFKVSTTGLFMNYDISGYASLSVQSAMPVFNIPEVSGVIQPSALLVALAKGLKATDYYQLDVDRNDAPTLVNHGAMTTSFNSYVRGTFSTKDDYESFPGLLKLSKSYSNAKTGTGLNTEGYVKKLSQLENNAPDQVPQYIKKSIVDNTPQSTSFSYWIDEPTMTQPGVIHFKSNANLINSHMSATLRFGTSDSNVLSLNGSYNGVAYNMSDMNFSSVGFSLDASGNQIANTGQIVNSWSASLADTFQTVNIINDIQAIATQFSGDFSVDIVGTTEAFTVAQPVSLIVISGQTVSPVSGIYNIVSVSHSISNSFITTLKIQRLVMSTANQVAAGQGIIVTGSESYPKNSYSKSKNIVSPYEADFGTLYPNFSTVKPAVK